MREETTREQSLRLENITLKQGFLETETFMRKEIKLFLLTLQTIEAIAV